MMVKIFIIATSCLYRVFACIGMFALAIIAAFQLSAWRMYISYAIISRDEAPFTRATQNYSRGDVRTNSTARQNRRCRFIAASALSPCFGHRWSSPPARPAALCSPAERLAAFELAPYRRVRLVSWGWLCQAGRRGFIDILAPFSSSSLVWRNYRQRSPKSLRRCSARDA